MRLNRIQKIIFALFVLALVAIAAVALLRSVAPSSKVVAAIAPAPEAQKLDDSQAQAFIEQHYKGNVVAGTQAALVAKVGAAINNGDEVRFSHRTLNFHLLAEPIYLDVFATQSGDVYVTTALVNRMKTEAELGAALSIGAAHALDGDRPSLTNDGHLQYTVAQETVADTRTVKITADGGYDPNAILSLLTILTDARNEKADVSFFTTHPSPEWRTANIENAIKAKYPNGVPAVLSK